MSKLVRANQEVIELDILSDILKQQKSHRTKVKGPK